MASPWAAVASTADPIRSALAIARAREALFAGAAESPTLRPVVTSSWQRCAAAGIDPNRDLAPIPLGEDEVADRWEQHPLCEVMPALRGLLAEAADDARQLVVVTDATGHLLVVEGDARLLRHAEAMHFVPGALWSEAAAGTNALGTALAIDHAVQIFSAEHFNRVVHAWTCSAAPIHDPETGATLGVIDLTGGYKSSHPYSLGLVTAAARLAEVELRTRLEQRDERLRARYLDRLARGAPSPSAVVSAAGRVVAAVPEGWLGTLGDVPKGGGEFTLPDGSPAIAEPIERGAGLLVWRNRPVATGASSQLELRALGRDEAEASLAEAPLRLSRRHSEILVLLALHAEGLSSERLLLELYGDAVVNPVTARAEMSRLRAKLGPWLAAKPYRLRADVRLDLLDVEQLLERGRLADAVAGYPGPLLPSSQAPGVVAARDRLEGALRRSVIAQGDPELLWRWCRCRSGEGDIGALRMLAAAVPDTDPRGAWALSALDGLLGG